MSDPRKLLEKILSAVANDVDKIVDSQTTSEGKAKKLSPEDALTLTRYSVCLLNISEDKKKKDEDEKNEFSKLPKEEQIKLAKKAVKDMEKQLKSADKPI